MKVGEPLSRKELQFIIRQSSAGKLKYTDRVWMNNLVRTLAMDLLNKMNAKEELDKELDILRDKKKKKKPPEKAAADKEK